MSGVGALRPLSSAFLALALLGCGDAPQERPLAGVLITLDTTQSAALGVYGAGPEATPHLDALAAESVLYTGARTVAPITLPAHASMLTGLVPPRHSVRDNGLAPVPLEATTLAERARARGFETAAFVSAVVLGSSWGLAQGFDTYDGVREAAAGLPTEHMNERRASDTTAAAVRWLETRDPERPFFLWVHYFDPHEPYDPPAPYRSARAAAGDRRALYAGEVRAMDAAIGTLFDALERTWGFENLFLTVVADHGEGFGVHGEDTHSVLVYEELLHVPLFVRHPGRRGVGGARRGERSDAIASVVDVYPTFLEALALGPPGDVDGLSLASADPPPERGAYFESMSGYLAYGWCPLTGWIDARGKYTHGTTPELYDLAADPLERRNLAAARPEALEPYRAAIARTAGLPALERGADEAVDENARAGIGALGYANVAGGEVELPHPLAETGWPDPRTRLGELQTFYDATLRFNAAFPKRDRAGVQGAIASMTALVDANPNNVYALNVLASFLFQVGDHANALRRLQAIPPHGVDRLTVQDMMGHCLEALGQKDRALLHFLRAEELKPGDPHQIEDVVRILRALGKDTEAAAFAARQNS